MQQTDSGIDLMRVVAIMQERDAAQQRVAELEAALRECVVEIEYERNMLSEEERNHPRGSGWARVYDKAQAALKL